MNKYKILYLIKLMLTIYALCNICIFYGNRYGDDAIPFSWNSMRQVTLFKYSNFGCVGSENSLLSCSYINKSNGINCNSEIIVGLKCPGKTRGVVLILLLCRKWMLWIICYILAEFNLKLQFTHLFKLKFQSHKIPIISNEIDCAAELLGFIPRRLINSRMSETIYYLIN